MDASLLQRIDFLTIAINLGGNKKSIRDLLTLFMKSSAESLEKLEEAEQQVNIISWLQNAHKLKGASKNVGAKRLASLCLEAEDIKKLPHQQSGAVLYHMSKELAHLRDAVNAYLATLG